MRANCEQKAGFNPSISLAKRGNLMSREIVNPTIDLSIFRQVVEVGFVVRDLERTVNYWENLGLRNIRRNGVQNVSGVTYRGKQSPLTLKTAHGNIGHVRIGWIEPIKGTSDFDKFLERHGDGVHHLAYRVKSRDELEKQVAYFGSKGVEVSMDVTWARERGEGKSVFFDTAERGGGMTYELTYDPAAPEFGKEPALQNSEPFNRITQYGFVGRDLKKIGDYYESIGFGSVPVDYVDYSTCAERFYRGQPGKFEIYANMWHWGSVDFEWLSPAVGPSVFEEYVKNHGEGIHHLKFSITDLDKEVAKLAAKRAKVAQNGGFDYQGNRGRFAYVDTEPYGGVMIEFVVRES